MFSLVVVACLGGDPQGTCQPFISPIFHETEEACVEELLFQALPYFETVPPDPISFQCIYTEELEPQT